MKNILSSLDSNVTSILFVESIFGVRDIKISRISITERECREMVKTKNTKQVMDQYETEAIKRWANEQKAKQNYGKAIQMLKEIWCYKQWMKTIK